MMTDAETAKTTTVTDKTSAAFTDEERSAMKERAHEVKAAKQRGGAAPKDDQAAVLAKIAEMPAPDRGLGRAAARGHHHHGAGAFPKAVVRDARQERQDSLLLSRRAQVQVEVRDGGVSDQAHLDDGALWPTTFAVTEWTAAAEEKLTTLIRSALT